MKAVIVEIKGSDAAALSEDGRISKIKNRNYATGQEIVLRNNNKFIKFAASAAASLVLLGTPAWAYLTPYSYVSLDINPSFEFSINRFDRVLNVKAVNDDGAEVVEKISIDNLKNKEIKEAVKNILVGLKDQGYIIEGKEGGVVVATSSKSQEKTDELAISLKAAVEEEVKFNSGNAGISEEKDKDKQDKEVKEGKEIKEEKAGKPVEGEEAAEEKEKPEKTEEVKKTKEVKVTKEVNKEDKEDKEDKREKQDKQDKENKEDKEDKKNIKVEVIEVSNEEVSEAKEHNVTPGKMNLVRKLEIKSGKTFDEATFSEWLNRSVQEIMEEIKKYDEEEKADKKEAKKEQKENTKEEKSNKESDNNSKNKSNKN